MDAGNGREIPRYALPCHPVRGRKLFFPRQADGEDAVFVYPLMDFVETGAGDELVHFLLAAAAHHPIRAACLVTGERAGNQMR